MKAIQKYNDLQEWVLISAGYSGLSQEQAKKHIAQLRQWAKDDESGARYRLINVDLIPR